MRRKSAWAAVAAMMLAGGSSAWAQAKGRWRQRGAGRLPAAAGRADRRRLPAGAGGLALLGAAGPSARGGNCPAAGRYPRRGARRRVDRASTARSGTPPHPWPWREITAALAPPGHVAGRPGLARPVGRRPCRRRPTRGSSVCAVPDRPSARGGCRLLASLQLRVPRLAASELAELGLVPVDDCRRAGCCGRSIS
jgi:hypothetical protein